MPSSSIDGASLAGLFREYANAYKVLGKEDSLVASKLCEVGKAYLLRKAKSLVTAAEGRAILLTYGSDSTPLLSMATMTTNLHGHRTVVRKAGQAVEFLVERAFLKTTSATGDPLVTCLFKDPTPLTQGKTAWCEFTAASRFFPLLRTLGHTGVAVNHYCFDRAMQSALSRRMQQRQCLYYEVVGGPGRQGGSVLQELLDWQVSTACAAHDAHNALKWSGLGPRLGAEEAAHRRRIAAQRL